MHSNLLFVKFYIYNACLHSAAATIEAMTHLNFEFLHSAHGLDLAVLNYHLFGPLIEALLGWRSGSDDEVKDVVHICL